MYRYERDAKGRSIQIPIEGKVVIPYSERPLLHQERHPYQTHLQYPHYGAITNSLDDFKYFRSLVQAVRFILQEGGGQIQFPSEQVVVVDLRNGNIIRVEHASHGWYGDNDDQDRIEEREGIVKVAKVVKRLSPNSSIKFKGYEDSLDEVDYEFLD